MSLPTEVTSSTAPVRIRMPITALAKQQQVTRLDSITSLAPVDVRWTGGLSNAVRGASSPARSFICNGFHRDGRRDGLGARTSEARVSHSSRARASEEIRNLEAGDNDQIFRDSWIEKM